MYVAYKGKKIIIFVAQYGFVPIFEEVPGAVMSPIEVEGIPGEELSHDGRNAVLATLKKNMHMIAHKDPSIDTALPFSHRLTEALKKLSSVLVVLEDCGFVDTAHHNMVQGTGDVQSGLSWHGAILSKANRPVNGKARYEPTSPKVSILAREPEIVRDRGYRDCRFTEGFIVRRPDNGAGRVRHLLWGT